MTHLEKSVESPVFVSMYEIAHIEDPETCADEAGRMAITALHGNTLHGAGTDEEDILACTEIPIILKSLFKGEYL